MATTPTRVQSVFLSGIQSIPSEFVRPVNERPDAETFHNVDIPLIDFSSLGVDELREKTVADIGRASHEWGIFQLTNHGISDHLFERLQAAGRDFFGLSQEEKEAYANLDGVTDDRFEGYGTKLKCTSDGRQGWSDFYFHMLWPPSLTDFNKWPSHPSFYRDVTEEYGRGIFGVVDKLLAAFSIGLELEESTLKNALRGENLELELKINYYPPANYIPNTLIIHIGDQLQILSNGKYNSVLHRTLVSRDRVRMSWPVFCNPPLDLVVSPLKELLDENIPPLFDGMTFREFKNRKKTKTSEQSSSIGN